MTTPDQPTATATPRTIEQAAQECAEKIYGLLFSSLKRVDTEDCKTIIAAAMREVVERELSSAQAELAEAKADNESLRTLWTEIRTVLIQSRAANCVCSYGALQADAVEAANAVLKRMPPDVTNERDQLRSRVAELEQDIKGVLEECSKHITLSNDFPWSEEVYCTFHHFESELKAVRKQANDEFDAIITRNIELEQDKARLQEYAFGMETALRGARASGTASETALWAAECAELRLRNATLRAAIDAARKGQS